MWLPEDVGCLRPMYTALYPGRATSVLHGRLCSAGLARSISLAYFHVASTTTRTVQGAALLSPMSAAVAVAARVPVPVAAAVALRVSIHVSVLVAVPVYVQVSAPVSAPLPVCAAAARRTVSAVPSMRHGLRAWSAPVSGVAFLLGKRSSGWSWLLIPRSASVANLRRVTTCTLSSTSPHTKPDRWPEKEKQL